jgi:copper homeostasis protein
LCADIALGGTTPSAHIVRQAREHVILPLYVMIRPRGGNFEYASVEFEQMKSDISNLKALGVDGFVFGILNDDQTIQIEQNSELVALASPLPCTFHRAFDAVLNSKNALEDVISCGFSTLLTSGTYPNVMEGKDVLKQLIVQAQNRIQIMPGGGLRSTNISALNQIVNASWYHSSAITDASEIANPIEIMQLKEHFQL